MHKEQLDFEKTFIVFKLNIFRWRFIFSVSFRYKNMFPRKTLCSGSNSPLAQAHLYSHKIKLLQGRWCLIAFAHLALEAMSLEKEEEKGWGGIKKKQGWRAGGN